MVETELMDELKSIRKAIQKPALQYTDWNGEEVRRDVPVLPQQ